VLRCVCGHRILCEVQPEGECIGFLIFFDGKPTGETYGQRVESCPGCGEQLGLPVLYREDRARRLESLETHAVPHRPELL
jgi:hypothetical protein